MSKTRVEVTERILGTLVRMKPKPHEDMKIGKKRAKRKAYSKKKTG